MRVLFGTQGAPEHTASALQTHCPPGLEKENGKEKQTKRMTKPSTGELKQQTPGPKRVSASIKTTKGSPCQAQAQRLEGTRVVQGREENQAINFF